MTNFYIILAELSQADPLKDFQSWFFGSVAVLFVGLLVYNLLEMKLAIKALVVRTGTNETEIALIKQSQEFEEDLREKTERRQREMTATLERLNQTLTLLNAERHPR